MGRQCGRMQVTTAEVPQSTMTGITSELVGDLTGSGTYINHDRRYLCIHNETEYAIYFCVLDFIPADTDDMIKLPANSVWEFVECVPTGKVWVWQDGYAGSIKVKTTEMM